jgi:hypothetical protein
MRLKTFLLFMLALAGIPAAQAADIGFCTAPDAMTAALKAEDQHSIVSAQLITQEKRLYGLIVTMSGDRKTGYILKADQPLGDPAKQLCVYNRLANVRLFDARKPGVPPSALLKAPEEDALRHCDELAAQGKFTRGACGSLNTDLRRVEASGQRVVVQAFIMRKDASGAYAPQGTLATITGRIGGSIDDFANPAKGILGALAYSSLPDGATILNATLVYVDYTPYGLTALQQ